MQLPPWELAKVSASLYPLQSTPLAAVQPLRWVNAHRVAYKSGTTYNGSFQAIVDVARHCLAVNY